MGPSIFGVRFRDLQDERAYTARFHQKKGLLQFRMISYVVPRRPFRRNYPFIPGTNLQGLSNIVFLD